jgi:hypothetical protein
MNTQNTPLSGCGLIAVSGLMGAAIVGLAIGVLLAMRQPDAAASATPIIAAAAQPAAPEQNAVLPSITPRSPAAAQRADEPVNPPTLSPSINLPPENTPAAPLPPPEQANVTSLIVETAQPLPTYTPNASLTPYPTYTPFPTPTFTPSPTPLPVVDWKRSGTLDVLEWTTTVVIEKSRAKEGVRVLVPGQDRVVLIVNGKLRAGVDLTRVEPRNVAIDGTSIRIVVPKPTIYSIELLPAESRVYDAERSWVFSDYTGLEVEAMDQARRELAAPNPTNTRMLETAEAVARLQLTNFLRDLGFQRVDVNFAK